MKEAKFRAWDGTKMIPEKYVELAMENFTESDFDFSKKRLFKKERFKFELTLFEKSLKSNEPYVYELIEGVKATKVFQVECKFNEDRHEILYGKYSLKCSKEIYDFAEEKMQFNKKSQI